MWEKKSMPNSGHGYVTSKKPKFHTEILKYVVEDKRFGNASFFTW
jgi:hypothetical protein